MTKILVDTDILIDYTKGYDLALRTLLEKQAKGKVTLFVNSVVLAEFFSNGSLSNRKKYDKAVEFFGLFGFVEINKKAGLLAGELLREKKANFLGDALISATCLLEGMSLASRNKKHFAKIPNLKILEV